MQIVRNCYIDWTEKSVDIKLLCKNNCRFTYKNPYWIWHTQSDTLQSLHPNLTRYFYYAYHLW